MIGMQQQLGNWGTISAFACRHRETKKNLCRGGRSQDLPDTDFQPAVRHLKAVRHLQSSPASSLGSLSYTSLLSLYTIGQIYEKTHQQGLVYTLRHYYNFSNTARQISCGICDSEHCFNRQLRRPLQQQAVQPNTNLQRFSERTC